MFLQQTCLSTLSCQINLYNIKNYYKLKKIIMNLKKLSDSAYTEYQDLNFDDPQAGEFLKPGATSFWS